MLIFHFVLAFLNLPVADSLYKWWVHIYNLMNVCALLYYSFSQLGSSYLQNFCCCVLSTVLSPGDSVVNKAGWRGRCWWGLRIHKKCNLTSKVSLETLYIFVYLSFVSSTPPPFLEIKGSKVACTLFSEKRGKMGLLLMKHFYIMDTVKKKIPGIFMTVDNL